ncbi:MAG: hypothetical protein JWO03_3917 [Bacteroidetes bacterium]|nr:hypothetical protein [Bacteroidota bacterium]
MPLDRQKGHYYYVLAARYFHSKKYSGYRDFFIFALP